MKCKHFVCHQCEDKDLAVFRRTLQMIVSAVQQSNTQDLINKAMQDKGYKDWSLDEVATALGLNTVDT